MALLLSIVSAGGYVTIETKGALMLTGGSLAGGVALWRATRRSMRKSKIMSRKRIMSTSRSRIRMGLARIVEWLT